MRISLLTGGRAGGGACGLTYMYIVLNSTSILRSVRPPRASNTGAAGGPRDDDQQRSKRGATGAVAPRATFLARAAAALPAVVCKEGSYGRTACT